VGILGDEAIHAPAVDLPSGRATGVVGVMVLGRQLVGA
jgi:hypothetical protein